MSSPSVENSRSRIEGNSSAIRFGVVHLGSRNMEFEVRPAARCSSCLAKAETISLADAAARAGHRKGVKGTTGHRRCNRHRQTVRPPERIVNAADCRSFPPFGKPALSLIARRWCRCFVTDHVSTDHGIRYAASVLTCRACALKRRCCPNVTSRRIVRYVNEDARDLARRKMKTKAVFKSRNQRKKVEIRFAHLKTHHGFERLRLRGLSGARDEFHLAATASTHTGHPREKHQYRSGRRRSPR
jgi:hypothetical protein